MKIENYKIENFFRRGFSFIELIIAMAIFGIMTAAMLVSLLGGKDAKAVEVAAREVAAAIREVQNNALTGKQDSANPSRKICRWLMYTYSNTPNYTVYYYYGDCTISFQQVYFNASLKNNVNFLTSDNVSFKLPHGTAESFGSPMSNPVKITLKSTNNATIKYTVCVYPSGRVEEISGDPGTCP
ncbi:MAG: hypothetical protein A3J63_02145 [Candidatus Moranbacteria bacterium RIFCSPHIGHO2_02_FULL_40_12b]|nr:MAG: hypothetical protein A3J63_02145 [Candidatus Moranbacteria bacterium RIFCSPHIGHO2_02_FULL_40_12b]